MGTTLIIIALVVVIAFIAFASLPQKHRTATAAYSRKPLLTPNELEFFHRLRNALPPHLIVCPQVAMSAIIQPNRQKEANPQEYMRLRGSIAQKIIDFVVIDSTTGTTIAILELDDKTHVKTKDQQRDALTASANIPTIRWNSRSKPTADQIRHAILSLQ